MKELPKKRLPEVSGGEMDGCIPWPDPTNPEGPYPKNPVGPIGDMPIVDPIQARL